MIFKTILNLNNIITPSTLKTNVYHFEEGLLLKSGGGNYKLIALTFSSSKDLRKFGQLWRDVCEESPDVLHNYLPFISSVMDGAIIVTVSDDELGYLHVNFEDLFQSYKMVDINLNLSKGAIATLIIDTELSEFLGGLRKRHPTIEHDLLKEDGYDTIILLMRHLSAKPKTKLYSVYDFNTRESKLREFDKLNKEGFDKLIESISDK